MARAENSPRGISLSTCTSLVVANIIGVGIFTSLGYQLLDLRAGFPIVLLWVVGGLFALCGALSYAELAAALPRSGGEYHFLARIYHPALGFMAGVTSATVGFAAPVAIGAMAFGSYFSNVLPGADPRLLAFAVVIFVTLAHAFTLRIGSAFQNTFTVLKLLLILIFIGAAIFLVEGEPVTWRPAAGDGGAIFSGAFAVALIYVMYSYSGWNAAVYIVGEVRDPARTIARALVLGTALVTVLYVLLNIVFMLAAPADALRGQVDVGHVAARGMFGQNGGRIMAGLISFGLISSISAMTWAGPRVLQTMGEDHRPLAWLARKSTAGIPLVALGVQTLLVCLLLATATFESAVNYAQFTLTLCSVLTVAGVMVLRCRHPHLPRPFRCPAYPIPPLVFLAIGLITLGFVIREKPVESVAGLLTLAAATGLYWLARDR